jgi:CheY-like chemotaxis protein
MPDSPIIVLLVDDQPDITETFQLHLERFEHFIVYTAADGVAGLEAFYAATPRPSCVVLDVRMPEMDGNQLARALRGDPETADIPIIILTAYAQPQHRLLGEASGADFYLEKPIKPSDLAAKIREAIAITTEQRKLHMHRLADDNT